MHKITPISDLVDGASRGFELETAPGQSFNVFVVRKGSQFFVYENRCPHLGVNLDWMEHEFLDESGTHIQCATHMALFNIEDGQCIAGPCVGDHLSAVASEVRDGDLYADLDSIE